jgi:hypothetical protein
LFSVLPCCFCDYYHQHHYHQTTTLAILPPSFHHPSWPQVPRRLRLRSRRSRGGGAGGFDGRRGRGSGPWSDGGRGGCDGGGGSRSLGGHCGAVEERGGGAGFLRPLRRERPRRGQRGRQRRGSRAAGVRAVQGGGVLLPRPPGGSVENAQAHLRQVAFASSLRGKSARGGACAHSRAG